MDGIPLGVLFGVLLLLIALSAFFSGSETGLMTLNRYRLRHLARAKHPGALRAQKLLERPDRLIGLILLGNNLVNILASMLATVIALRLMGEAGLVIAAAVLTLLTLIFAEVAPKTLAALHPERIAYPAAYVYIPLLRLLYPVVWLVNAIANGLLRLLGVSTDDAPAHSISSEELRTVVVEAGAMIPKRHQKMLLNLLDLERVTVDDIMVPRNEVVGIDIKEDADEIAAQLSHSQYTRLPIYEDSVDNIIGFVHLRNVLPLLIRGSFSADELRKVMREPYFIPEGTPLNKQLLNFQRERRRIGLVVDEYGDIRGLVTLADLLEEVVGEFTTDPTAMHRDIVGDHDGSFVVDAGINLRDLNRHLHTQFPTGGPKTLNGLVLEHMEDIPEPGTSMLLAGYPVDILQTKDNAVKTVRIHPTLRRPPRTTDS